MGLVYSDGKLHTLMQAMLMLLRILFLRPTHPSSREREIREESKVLYPRAMDHSIRLVGSMPLILHLRFE